MQAPKPKCESPFTCFHASEIARSPLALTQHKRPHHEKSAAAEIEQRKNAAIDQVNESERVGAVTPHIGAPIKPKPRNKN